MQTSIRLVETADLDRIARLANDRGIAQMTSRLPYPYTRSDAQTWFDYITGQDNEYVFAICENSTLIGIVGLVHEPEHRRAELGYWLGRSYWNRGHASAAARMLIGYAFASLDVHKVYARCMAENQASARVLEKNGFVLEGRLRQHVVRMGAVHDLLSYGLLNADYDPRGQ